MLKTTVSYHLNSKGMEYFIKWFEDLKSVIAKQEGFIEISYTMKNSKDALAEDLCIVIIVVYFENELKLTQWLATDRHKVLADKIRPHFLKAPDIERKEVEKRGQVDP